MKLNSIFLLVLTCFLFACAQKPKTFIVAPVMEYKPQTLYMNKKAQLTVTDLRANSHSLAVLKEGEAADLYSSPELLTTTVENALKSAFKEHGLNLAVQSVNAIEVIIDNARVTVDQTMMKYTATSQLSLRVIIKNGDSTLTKTFGTKGASNGPLKADIGVLERDLNRQLGELLVKIVTNPEVQQFIK